jgi:hypothetical protein
MSWQHGQWIYPDAEQVATLYLRAQLAALAPEPDYATGTAVAAAYPPARDAGRYVRFRRSGGTSRRPNDYPRLDVQVWHEDYMGRMNLAQLALSLIGAADGAVVSDASLPRSTTLGEVSEFVGPGRFDDPEVPGRELILFTVEIPMRGAAV